MTAAFFATRTVHRHVLDIAAVLAHTDSRLLPQITNAAGRDGRAVDMAEARSSSTHRRSSRLIIEVEPLVLDGPYEAHLRVRWRATGGFAPPRAGDATLLVLGLASGPHAWTELTLTGASQPTRPLLAHRGAARLRRRAGEYLDALARHLDVQLPAPTSNCDRRDIAVELGDIPDSSSTPRRGRQVSAGEKEGHRAS